MTVTADQRFTASHPCPVCDGYGGVPRGRGERCYGFLSTDGQYAHCTREEHAGGLSVEPDAQTYAHRLTGDCCCGASHGAAPVTAPRAARAFRRRIVATYPYTDEQDGLIYEIVRYDPKDFAQRRPDGQGGWIWNLDGVRRVPYRLREVIDVATAGWRIYITEGEKDAEALHALGLCATTNPGGAGNWLPEYVPHFRGAQVVIIADKDEPGRRHAQEVARSLYSTARSVKVIELPVTR